MIDERRSKKALLRDAIEQRLKTTRVVGRRSASIWSRISLGRWEAEELADLLADNRFLELAELDEDDLKRVIESIRNSDPAFDAEITGFMENEAPPFRFIR